MENCSIKQVSIFIETLYGGNNQAMHTTQGRFHPEAESPLYRHNQGKEVVSAGGSRQGHSDCYPQQ
jgi:hypothetical protein